MPNYNVPAVPASVPRLIRTPNTLPPCPPSTGTGTGTHPPTVGQLWPRGDFDK